LWKYCDKARFNNLDTRSTHFSKEKPMKPVHLVCSTVLVLSTSLAFAEVAPPPNLNPAPILANKLSFANASARYITPVAGANTTAPGAATSVRAYVDPDTGALTKPTQLHLLEDAERAKSDKAKTTGAAVHSMAALSGGGMRAKVNESASSQMVATIDADGVLSINCQDDHGAAAHPKGKPHSHRQSVANEQKGVSHVK
jgi:hypothetical protein